VTSAAGDGACVLAVMTRCIRSVIPVPFTAVPVLWSSRVLLRGMIGRV
jgi:hypothetical protein